MIIIIFMIELDTILKEASSLDMVFMLDCTGSMKKYIDAAKENILMFVDQLNTVVPDILLRLAFVGYRDPTMGRRDSSSFHFQKMP
jgi:hypothetical protein